MRHALALLLAACLALTGCGGSTPVPTAQQQLKQPLSTLMDQLVEDYGLPMPLALDDELLHGLIGVQPDQIAQYSGYISMNGDCPDHIIAIQAAPDCAEQVAMSLETRRTFLLEAYSDRPDARSRVQAGCVVFRGDYVFLLVAGRQGNDPATEVAEMTKIIEDNFEK